MTVTSRNSRSSRPGSPRSARPPGTRPNCDAFSFLDGEGAPVAEVQDRGEDGATVITRRAIGLYRDGELVERMLLPWTAPSADPSAN